MRTEINHATAEKFIEDYLFNSDAPTSEWDMDMAASLLRDWADYEHAGYEDLDPDGFTAIMEFSYKGNRLKDVWDMKEIQIDGYRKEDGCTSPIDRDQAVDDGGKAYYDSYSVRMPFTNSDEHLEFSADDMEEFAKTW